LRGRTRPSQSVRDSTEQVGPRQTFSRPFAQSKSNLDAAGIPAGVAKPGSALLDFELLDARGGPTTLASARAGQPAVVVFYRGARCPYCNIALRTYQSELVPALAVREFELIAISPQKPDGSLTAQQTNELTYTVRPIPAIRSRQASAS
jgi:hypothetical protein